MCVTTFHNAEYNLSLANGLIRNADTTRDGSQVLAQFPHLSSLLFAALATVAMETLEPTTLGADDDRE